MAVIGKIRKHSGLLIGIIGVALAAFVLGDISKTQSRGTNNVGEVNGEKISYKSFSTVVEQNIESEKKRRGKQSLSSSESFFVREQTWNNMVNEIIFEEELANLGLGISVEELSELIHGKNVHPIILQYFTDPNTGEFNPERVRNIINNFDRMSTTEQQQWHQLEQTIKQNQLIKKYSNLIAKGYYMPEGIAEAFAQNNSKYASIKLLAKNFSNVPDSLVSVTESDIKKYYNDHIDEFQMKEENRNIEYIVFDILPSVKDRTETREYVNEIYKEFQTNENTITYVNSVSDDQYDSTFFKESSLPVQIAEKLVNAKVGTYVEPYSDNDVYYMAKLMDKQFRPDSMQASHILISYKGARGAKASLQRTKEEAKQLADSLQKVITKNPKKFADLAVQFSSDPSVKKNKGNLGWFADGSMLPSFNNAVLNASVGEIFITETDFGFHVIDTDGKKNISWKYRIAIISRAVEPSEETFQSYYTIASKFATENTDYDSFSNAAKEMGLNKRSFPSMNRMTNYIYSLDNPRQIVQWAFNDERKVNDISPIFEFTNKYVLAILTGIEKEGDRSLDVVRELVELKVREEKKAEYLLAQIKGINEINKIAAKWDVKAQETDVNFTTAAISSYGREPKVAGEIFGMSNGETATFIGNKAVYFIKLKEIKNPETSNNTSIIKTQLEGNFTNRVYQNGVINALVKVSDIEDNRHLFY
jgi:peptidyl-prolyl cis-trans isomerase D